MRNIFSSHRRALRRARKKGKLHGKSNHPHELWGDRPVPFLEKIHAQFSKRIQELQNQLHVYRGQSVTLTEEDVVGIAEAKEEIANLISESSAIKVEIEKLDTEKKVYQMKIQLARLLAFELYHCRCIGLLSLCFQSVSFWLLNQLSKRYLTMRALTVF